jgi:VIT1/CCC1 family predicted Fe2+/Mn2+ transporter
MSNSSSIDSQLLNRLRAAVLGANDGIVSTSSVVMGVAGAGANNKAIFTAGMAALVAGALSMAVGEYVSVASQKDAEKAHADAHDTDDDDPEFTSPTQAAVTSLLAFTAGGLVPFIAVILAPEHIRIVVTVLAVLVALVLTGYFSARIGKADPYRATARVVTGGLVAMAVTYYIGTLFGSVIG